MKLRTMFAVAALGLASLACGGGGGSGGAGGYSLPTVAMCSPFTDLSLPVDDGNVISCSENAVSIQYSSGDKKALFDKYYDAIKAKASNEIVAPQESSGSWTAVTQDGNKMNYALNASDVAGAVYITIGANKSPM
jgi:hypothetical protein